jgi:translation initiation factor IF-2
MKRQIVLTAAFALLALGPVVAEAQRAGTPEQRIEDARARAARAGIPTELLEARIAEGRAKGVAEDRIAHAVERRANGLVQAQEAMGRQGRRATTAELSAGADAIEAGVDGSTLRAVIQAARDEERPVALAVLGELVRQGLPVGEALNRVTLALQKRGDALANLPHQAAAERAGRPAGPPAGAGGRPDGAGTPRGGAGGPPAAVPAAGQRPGQPAGPPAGRPGPPSGNQ